MTIFHCYELSFEYRTENGVSSTHHVYTAETPSEAIKSSLEFWKERHKHLPTIFRELLCCKIHPISIGPITNGRLHSGVGFPFFEYKIDTAGLPIEEYFKMQQTKLERYQS
jgi:hypothetical protein